MELRYQIILAALLLVNVIAFAAYGIDKRRARKGKWRIQESTLLLLAFFGGDFPGMGQQLTIAQAQEVIQFFI